MNDNYFHSDDTVIYIETSIPGPTENTEEYLELFNNFNSQIALHCNCKTICRLETCACLHKTGYNYIFHDQNGKLNYLLEDTDLLHTYIECNDKCICAADCGNRLVQKGPVEGLYVQTCDVLNKGLGLFTSYLLQKGMFVCEYAGELITKSQAVTRHRNNMLNGISNYIFCLNEYSNGNIVQTFVDPTYFGNIGRYINHSCEPNCQVVPVRWNSPIPKLAVFANVDVPPGTELTFNYGAHTSKPNQLNLATNLIKCLCKSNKCIGYMPYDYYN